MNFYDKIKSPFENTETIEKIIELFSNPDNRRRGAYDYIVKYNGDKEIIDSEYMDNFDEYIFWPCMEHDWQNIKEEYKDDKAIQKVFDRFKTYKEYFYLYYSLDKNIRVKLNAYIESLKDGNKEESNRYKKELLKVCSKEVIYAKVVEEKIRLTHDFTEDGSMGFHVNSKNYDKTSKQEKPDVKFYINAGTDSYKVANLFLEKCREAKLDSYYFKVVNPMKYEQKRSDKLCIYSTIEHTKKILEILNQIKNENPDIIFNKPPLATGVIDDFIGFGTDTLKKENSYNQTITETIENTLKDFFDERNIEYNDSFKYIKENPEVLKEIKEKIVQRCAEKGCSRDKICISDEIAEKLKNVEIEIESRENNQKNEFSSMRRGKIQKTDEYGNRILDEYINPELLKRKIKLPNGKEIPARQYILENLFDYIPEIGTFTLKSNGGKISVKQYIEEFIMFELGNEKYNGDLEALLRDTVVLENSVTEKEDAADKTSRKQKKTIYATTIAQDRETEKMKKQRILMANEQGKKREQEENKRNEEIESSNKKSKPDLTMNGEIREYQELVRKSQELGLNGSERRVMFMFQNKYPELARNIRENVRTSEITRTQQNMTQDRNNKRNQKRGMGR